MTTKKETTEEIQVPPNMIERMSPSRLKTFQSCKLKYYYSYVDKLPRGETNDGARCGSVVHEMYEQMFLNDNTSTFSPYLMDACKKFGVTTKTQMTKIVKNAKSLMAMGYYDNANEVFAVEETIDLLLKDNLSRIYGFIDRLDIVGQSATIIDIKTQKNDFPQSELDDNLQAKFYTLAIKRKYPNLKSIKVEFWQTASGNVQKCDFYDECDEVEEYAIEQFADIVYCEDFVPTKNKFCFWCDAYKAKLCPIHTYKTYSAPLNPSAQVSQAIKDAKMTCTNKVTI